MSDKKEPIFADGIIFKAPSEQTKEKAPWVKGHISIKVPELIIFLEKYNTKGGWINLDLKKSKEKGTLYLELNQWKPEPKDELGLDNPKVAPDTSHEPCIDPETGIDCNAEDIPF
jgi:hypothetical protein